MDGCWLPKREGDTPVAKYELAWLAQVAVAQGGEDADHGVLAGEHVDERDPDLLRVAVRLPGDAHEPTQGLHDGVVAR